MFPCRATELTRYRLFGQEFRNDLFRGMQIWLDEFGSLPEDHLRRQQIYDMCEINCILSITIVYIYRLRLSTETVKGEFIITE